MAERECGPRRTSSAWPGEGVRREVVCGGGLVGEGPGDDGKPEGVAVGRGGVSRLWPWVGGEGRLGLKATRCDSSMISRWQAGQRGTRGTREDEPGSVR